MKYFLLFALVLIQGGEKIVIKSPWIRPAPEKFNTAFYCTIKNNSSKPDTLYKAASDKSDNVQIHETYKKGDMTGMKQVKELVIAPHDSLVFKPGGYHFMLMNLKENAAVNQTIEMILFFKAAGKIMIKADVRK